jgi:hypothetical protein
MTAVFVWVDSLAGGALAALVAYLVVDVFRPRKRLADKPYAQLPDRWTPAESVAAATPKTGRKSQ